MYFQVCGLVLSLPKYKPSKPFKQSTLLTDLRIQTVPVTGEIHCKKCHNKLYNHHTNIR